MSSRLSRRFAKRGLASFDLLFLWLLPQMRATGMCMVAARQPEQVTELMQKTLTILRDGLTADELGKGHCQPK